MQRTMLKSKIHRATVTEANVDYVGSITIDRTLTDAVGIFAGEKVLVVDNSNGARLETYVMAGEAGSGTVCMNGAAAHLIKKGDNVTIMGFELSDVPIEAKKILLDADNKILR